MKHIEYLSSIDWKEEQPPVKEEKEEMMPAPMTSVVLKSKAQKNKEKRRRLGNLRNDSEWSVAFSFLTRSDRDLFMTNRFMDMKSFSCQYCGIETENYQAFKAHLTLFHSVTFDCYRCWECPKLFRTVHSQITHAFYKHMDESLYNLHGIDLMDTEQVKQFEELPIEFRFYTFLTEKRSIKIDSSHKDYVCPLCLRNFRSFNAMTRHMTRQSYAKGHVSRYDWFKEWQF